MDRTTPAIRDLAQRLLTYEAAVGGAQEVDGAAVFEVCEKLRRPLSTLAGPIGFHSLLFRALTVAKTELPSLKVIDINEHGSLEFPSEAGPELNSHEAGALLIAQLLGLLCAFIGETLTLRLVAGVWPQESSSIIHNGPIESRKDDKA